MTNTLSTELRKMNAQAERIKSDEHASVSLAIGDNLRQGDIYVVRVNRMPAGKPRTSRQMAVGNTQGSRHVLVGDLVSLVDADVADATDVLHGLMDSPRPYQIGPAFETAEPVTLTHPEHGDRLLTEAGCYQVIYQRALDGEEREMREQD